MRPTGERGAGSVLGVTLVACVLCLTAMLLPLYAVLVEKRAVAGAADAAALAAADARAGILPGEPCPVAAAVVAANGAELGACTVDGLVVTVTARGSFAGFAVGVSATAGPPGTGEYTGVE